MQDNRIDPAAPNAHPSEFVDAPGQEVSKSSNVGRGKTGKMSLSIGQKLMGIIFLIIGLLGVVAGTGIYQMQNIGNEIAEIAEQDMPLTEAITAVTVHQLEQAINFERLLRYGAEMQLDDRARGHFATAFEKFEELTKKVDVEIVEAEEIAKGAVEHAATPAAREEFEKILHALEKIEGEHADYEKHVEHVVELIEAGEMTEALESAEEIEVEEEQLNHELEALLIEIEAFTLESTKTAQEHEAFGLILMIAISTVAAIGGFLATFFVVRLSVLRPLNEVVGGISALAKGDHSLNITVRSNDEIGQVAKALQELQAMLIEAEKLREQQAEEQEAKVRRAQVIEDMIAEFDRSASSALESVGSAATEMQSTAESMSATAEQTNKQANAVAAAAEQATANVQTVASAAEEMSASIGEISRQVANSGQIAKRAVEEADRTNDTVQGLAGAAEKIGEVVNLIQDIAEQINLLALNATIEAARAGDAGKGFAVVASEVKSLANQTAKATEEINSQITGMQTVAGEAVEAIGSIGKTINEVDETAAAIASAVEEQTATTEEIARNVQEAAAGTQEVSSNITGVTEGAGETGKAATQVLEASTDLSRQSEDLRKVIDKVIADIRAA